MAYELVETIEVGAGGAASIEFTSIPQTGVDLLLVLSGRSTRVDNNDAVTISLNEVTTGGLRNLVGDGSTVDSNNPSGLLIGQVTGANATANTFSSISTYISNYTSLSNKVFSSDSVIENNATFAVQIIAAGRATVTSSITSVGVSPNNGNFVQYSTASLYIIS